MGPHRSAGTEPGERRLNGPQTSGRPYRDLSRAEYGIEAHPDVATTTSDGRRLMMDVFLPTGAGQTPALVAASPYPRQLQNTGAPFGFIEAGATDFFVPRGYAHVIANVPGTGGSEGIYGLFDGNERAAVHDLVEWVAAQPWCDGNVGMIGISAFAMAQLEAAVERPAHLRAIFPVAATLDLYEAVYHHGVFSSRFATGFLGGIAFLAARSSRAFRNRVVDAVSHLLRSQPVHERFAHFKGEAAIAALAVVGARHISGPPWDDLFVALSVDHPTRDDFWAERDLAARLSQVEVPCYLGCDWDNVPLHLPSTFTAWRGLTGRVPVRMALMGSGGLTWPWESLHIEALAWFDHWMKGRDTGILDGPPIRYWVPGAEEWRASDTWPPPTAHGVELALSGDGRLVPPAAAAGTRDYVVLAPTRGTRPAPRLAGELTWESTALRDPVEVVGPVEVVLDAASTATDTAWMFTLQDVADDGEATNVTAGWLRAALRDMDDAHSEPGRPELPCRSLRPVPPGEVVRYRVPLVDTARRFGRHHRIRLVLASDDVRDGPDFSGFQHTPIGGTARHTVHASSILRLPVVDGDEVLTSL